MNFTNLKEVVEQLEKCKFTDEIGHPLENNRAFQFLKEIAEESPIPCPYYDETEIYTLPVVTFSKNAPWDAKWNETVVLKDMKEAHKLMDILEKYYGIKNHHKE